MYIYNIVTLGLHYTRGCAAALSCCCPNAYIETIAIIRGGSREWETKPRRGKLRKAWIRLVDELFVSLGLDEHEWVEDIKKGESSLASFLFGIEESRQTEVCLSHSLLIALACVC